jgi:hypothetical protein
MRAKAIEFKQIRFRGGAEEDPVTATEAYRMEAFMAAQLLEVQAGVPRIDKKLPQGFLNAFALWSIQCFQIFFEAGTGSKPHQAAGGKDRK